VHVHTLSATPIYREGQSVINQHLASLSHEHEQLYLKQLSERLLATQPELAITVEALDRPLESMRNESLGHFLAAHVATSDIDLVVMTTHGRGGLASFWLGSVADTFVRLSRLPTLLWRPNAAGSDFARSPVFKHILIPLDGSRLAEQILAPTLALGTLMQAEYTLLRVIEPVAVPSCIHEVEATASTYLHQVAKRLAAEGKQVATRITVADQPATAILAAAERHKSDLIAVATHGRSGLRRLLIGSVADKVLRGATIPVLTYCPQELDNQS
jgi:nucleotide-binding universal stress UspA family protein